MTIRSAVFRGGAHAAARVNGRLLRVLAYHGVDDLAAFARQLDYLREFWKPVSTADVIALVRGETALDPLSVWVTFDDGLRSTIVHARTLLDEYGISAAAFVNPGVVTENQTQWWDAVSAAVGGERVSELKRIPDYERRLAVQAARQQLDGRPLAKSTEVATLDEIRAWVAAGHSIGNHTWDHPMLDQCSAQDQRFQIERSHDWLSENRLMGDAIFAYPNGDWTPESESSLKDLGYQLGLLFDHKLANAAHSLRISRLRIDSSADVDRLSLILSGMHSGAFGLAQKLGIRQ